MFFAMSKGLVGIEKARSLRKKVFVDEQNIDINIEQDEKDQEAYHLVLIDQDFTIGVGRILLNGDVGILGRIAIDKSFRGQGYGELLLLKLIDRAKNEFGMKSIEIHAQKDVIDFYEKFGFVEVGKRYIEADIEHQKMILDESTLNNFGL